MRSVDVHFPGTRVIDAGNTVWLRLCRTAGVIPAPLPLFLMDTTLGTREKLLALASVQVGTHRLVEEEKCSKGIVIWSKKGQENYC